MVGKKVSFSVTLVLRLYDVDVDLTLFVPSHDSAPRMSTINSSYHGVGTRSVAQYYLRLAAV